MLSHLEEYHTGMMMYGNPYFGILEIWYTVMLVHLTAAAMPSIWHLYVFTLRGTPLCECCSSCGGEGWGGEEERGRESRGRKCPHL